MAVAEDAGEHFPESIENAVDGVCGGRGVVVVDVLGKHLSLSGGVFAEVEMGDNYRRIYC